MKKNHVLIVGAGPVGLSFAAALAKYGIASTIIEKDPKFLMIPKASTLHPPTLEIFEELGLIDKLLTEGLVADKLQYWDRPTKEIIATFDLKLLKDETKYPYRLQLEQSDLQVILEEHFRNSELVNILFEHELVSFKQTGDGVSATVLTKEGEVKIEADFLVGSDGASSTVRNLLGINYEGFTYETKFLVLGIVDHDFKGNYEGLNDVSYFYDLDEFVALIHNHRMWKMMFKLDNNVKNLDDVSDEFLQSKIRAFAGVDKEFNFVHKTIFNVHQRVASSIYEERVVLIGDAAHINNPLGGMGMNSGIHDAYFLAKDFNKLYNDKNLSIEKVLSQFQENRHFAIQEVQRRTVENERSASKTEGADNAADKMKRISNDEQLAKRYLMQSSMINDFKFMLKQNENMELVKE